MESLFQKGGANQYVHYAIIILTVSISVIYFFTIPQLFKIEKIVYTLFFSGTILLSCVYLCETIVELIYGRDYELFLNVFIANLFFYQSINFSLFGISILFLKYKNE